MPNRKKSDEASWVDLARGIQPSDSPPHPEDPRIDLFRRFHQFARAEAANRPPDSVLQRARALASRLPESQPGLLRTLAATLTFDSAAQPALAGLRSSGAGVRQLLFTAAGLDLHLRTEPASLPGHWLLAGQLLDPAGPDSPLAGLPVRLLSQNAEIAATSTSPFGEFQLTAPSGPGPLLEVRLESRQAVLKIDLASLLPPSES